jgi:hypothetical protein
VAGAFLREGRRLVLRGLHLLGSRTVVGMGLLLAVVTGIGAGRNLWISFSGTTAEGVVVRQIEELAADWSDGSAGASGESRGGVETAAAQRVFRAVVAFRDGSRSYEVMASARAIVHLYPLGTKVDVVYPRGRPERARLKPELPDFWIQAGVLLVATLLGAGSGYLWWKLAVRRLARRRASRVVKTTD